jgi:hypothetical protein
MKNLLPLKSTGRISEMEDVLQEADGLVNESKFTDNRHSNYNPTNIGSTEAALLRKQYISSNIKKKTIEIAACQTRLMIALASSRRSIVVVAAELLEDKFIKNLDDGTMKRKYGNGYINKLYRIVG